MSKLEKVLAKVLSGASDANIKFDDLCYLIEKLGYERNGGRGSHQTYTRGPWFLNLQKYGPNAKSYQVRQIREQLQQQGFQP